MLFLALRASPGPTNGTAAAPAGGESPDDEILDGLVKVAVVAASMQPESRDPRRRARQFNRKSCT